jgi:hypothetical protein
MMPFVYGVILGCVVGFIAGAVYCWVFIGARFILVRHYNQVDVEALRRSDLREAVLDVESGV